MVEISCKKSSFVRGLSAEPCISFPSAELLRPRFGAKETTDAYMQRCRACGFWNLRGRAGAEASAFPSKRADLLLSLVYVDLDNYGMGWYMQVVRITLRALVAAELQPEPPNMDPAKLVSRGPQQQPNTESGVSMLPDSCCDDIQIRRPARVLPHIQSGVCVYHMAIIQDPAELGWSRLLLTSSILYHTLQIGSLQCMAQGPYLGTLLHGTPWQYAELQCAWTQSAACSSARKVLNKILTTLGNRRLAEYQH